MGVGNLVLENIKHPASTWQKRLQTPNRYVGTGARRDLYVVRQYRFLNAVLTADNPQTGLASGPSIGQLLQESYRWPSLQS